MTSAVVDAVGTFALSLILAYGFLRLRCRKIGPPFGPHSRYWALFIGTKRTGNLACCSTLAPCFCKR